MQSDEAPPLVSMRRIVKRFGDFVANDQIDLDLAAGEIHALLGENGAGKSTLVKMLNGLLQPDEGEIFWQGEEIALTSPRDASEIGISMVYQNFSLFDNLTVAENINAAFTDHDSHGFNVRALSDRIIEIGEAYDLNLDPKRPVHTLSTGERQRIEIVRSLLRHPKLLILDEPTSVLTPQEAEGLFLTLTKLAAGGCAILYISHKLEEVQKLCSRATILRNARVVGSCDPRTTDLSELAAMMVGSTVPELRAPALHKIGEVRLQVEALSLSAEDPHGTDLEQIHFSVHGGEIVGIAGIAGNGQNELFAALSGECLAQESRQILIDTLP
ncbi:MAG: ATP-binding cassette domain-containing protein, partial [Methylocystaceae bacterium]|nr:ATP-binding cassette domain-containing protein [Methylocystaceae bacterium]